MPRFHVRHFEWQGAACVAAGTGYTGEDGVELAVPDDAAGELWQALLDAGVEPAGLGARDTLRLEAALPLHGHELGPGITPLQAGLGWVVAWDKPSGFRGKDALVAERHAGVARKLAGLSTSGRQPPRQHCPVIVDGTPVGEVTSGNFSPVLGHGIALALLPPGITPDASIEIEVRDRRMAATLTPLPFVRKSQQDQHEQQGQLMGHYVPHTDGELATMLASLGLTSLDELFDCVPAALRLASGLDLADGLSEPDTLDALAELAGRNHGGLVCFAGAGAYDHGVPAAARALPFRSEFVTAYTPYQPEVAQGVLQALFEYQTMVARLAGLPIANASLYDGAAATVEAVNLASAATSRDTVWVSGGLHPHWRSALATFAAGSGHDLVDIPLHDGRTAWPSTAVSGEKGAPGALVVASPNYLGCLEDLPAARSAADATGARLVVAADPVSAGLLRSPGSQGADVVVGEGQPFGTPLSFGGPYLGLFACRAELVRRLPGRLVGETVDVEGRRAYVSTLRAREQDIRREKASSNVCTNQTLIAVCCMVQLAWLGTSGLRELALRCARGTRYARDALLAIPGVEPLVEAPVLREFAVRLPADPAIVVDRMAEEGFLAGVPIGLTGGVATDVGDGLDALLVAVTERRTRTQIDAYAAALEKVMV